MGASRMTPREKAVLASLHYDETRDGIQLAESGRGSTSDLAAWTGAAGGVELRVGCGRRLVVSLDVGQMDQLVAWWLGNGQPNS